MQLSVNPDIVHGFETSRRKVVEALSNLNFAKIVSIVQLPNKFDPLEPHFQGEVEEVFASKHKIAPRHAYFSKFARNSQGVSVLGCFSIVDTSLGTSHASALPQLGDIVVGSFVEAGKKGKLPFEFKGWCNNGKPLLELHRVLQFGTRMSAKELHNLLRQPASISAAFSLRLNSSSVSSTQKRHAQKVALCVDDIWNIARALCFKDLQPDETLKISVPHWDMLTQLAMVTLDEEFLEELTKLKPPSEMIEDTQPEAQGGQAYNGYGGYAFQSFTVPQASDFGSRTPEYTVPRSGKTPPYAPSSPTFAPSSPAYIPESPKPESPKYSPESPKQDKSPEFKPPSPPKFITHADVLASLPKFDDTEMAEEGEVKKKAKKGKKTKSEANLDVQDEKKTYSYPSLYSPTTYSSNTAPSQLYSPSKVAEPEKPKSILGNLLAKINTSSVVSYQDI
jgi:hypothetical protein